VKIKKILNILIFFAFILNTFGCLTSYATTDVATKKKQTRAKINHLKWLENVETNKLYKNQQKLETANANLSSSKSQIANAQRELGDLQRQLEQASIDYNNLNAVLILHIRTIYKSQRKAYFEILLTSDDINMLVDRLYYQRVILKDDFRRMEAAKAKAREIRYLADSIAVKKRGLERSVASINSQKEYIKQAIAKNETMINSLKTDRVAYQKAEKELERQSASLSSYINKTTKTSSVQVASGFIKPIPGRITSPFGWRTHPIFNSRSFHSGVDIGGQNLGAIKASNSGKVIYSGWYGGYGKVVIVEHGIINGKPITTLYAHMNSIAVSNGQKVTKGQTLGYEGTTGYSTGPHCHFEVRVNGQPNNPLNYI
jgi:murein DD-endopeptidase MepM/ murein hydrolase activator NlpD